MKCVNFLVHRGNHDYLRVCAESILESSQAPLVLLGDKSNRRLADKLPLTHVDTLTLDGGMDVFRNMVESVQLTVNNRRYESFCYERWVYMLRYMKRNNVEAGVYYDSDTVLLSPIDDLLQTLDISDNQYAAICPQPLVCIPNLMVFSRHALELFVKFMRGVFNKGKQHAIEWSDWLHQISNKKLERGHLSDMFLLGDFIANHEERGFLPFTRFRESEHLTCKDIYTTALGHGMYVNCNIRDMDLAPVWRSSSNPNEVLTERKNVLGVDGWVENNPDNLKVIQLHFQGDSKNGMAGLMDYIKSPESLDPAEHKVIKDFWEGTPYSIEVDRSGVHMDGISKKETTNVSMNINFRKHLSDFLSCGGGARQWDENKIIEEHGHSYPDFSELGLTLALQGVKNLLPTLRELFKVCGGTDVWTPFDDYKCKGAGEVADVFTKFGSDKATQHSYHVVYNKILNDLGRGNKLNVLEIGLGTNNIDFISNMGAGGKPGASLRAWAELLPYSKVYGADVDKDILFNEGRIRTAFVNQLDREAFYQMHAEFGSPDGYDLIVDDGLHALSTYLNTLVFGLQHVRPGGYVVIEDVYDPQQFFQVVVGMISQNPRFSATLVEARGLMVVVRRVT